MAGISCAEKGDAAERTGGWLGGPYPERISYFQLPDRPFLQPLLPIVPVPFFFPSSFSPGVSLSPLYLCFLFSPSPLAYPSPTPLPPSSPFATFPRLPPPLRRPPSISLSSLRCPLPPPLAPLANPPAPRFAVGPPPLPSPPITRPINTPDRPADSNPSIARW